MPDYPSAVLPDHVESVHFGFICDARRSLTAACEPVHVAIVRGGTREASRAARATRRIRPTSRHLEADMIAPGVHVIVHACRP
jgi:hypothetical protein